MAKIGELYYDITAKDSGLAKVLEKVKKELDGADNAVVKLTDKVGDLGKLSDAFGETGKTVEQVKSQLRELNRIWEKTALTDTSGQKALIDRYKELSEVLNKYGKSADDVLKKEKQSVDTKRTFEQVIGMEIKTMNDLNAKLSEVRRVRNELVVTDANYVQSMQKLMQIETSLIDKQRQAAEIGKIVKTVDQQITEELAKRPKTIEAIIASQKRLKELYGKLDSPDTSNRAEQLKERYKQLSEELAKYGTIVPKITKEEMTFEKAMAMQSKTIGEMIAKQKALKEARLQADVSGKGGRYQVEQMNKEYERLNNTLKEYGVKEQRINETLLGKSRILSQVRNELGMYLSVYAAQRFLSEMVKIRGEYELQQTALGAILGSASDANKLFLQVQELGLKSPFSTLDLISYTKQLSAFKVATEELFDTTKALADISAGVGVDMSRLVLAFGQVRAASVLRGTEVRQFTEAGIPLVDELAKKFEELNGKAITTGEVFDKISARQVPFEMVRDILFDMTKAGGMFYNMQEIQAETLKGKIENLRDAYEKSLNTIGEGNSGVLVGAADAARFLVSNLDELVKAIKVLVAVYGIYRTAQILDTATTLGLAGATVKLVAMTNALTIAQ